MGVRALATGLPLSMLAEGSAHADPSDAGTPPCATNPQYIYLLTSVDGDPMNANVPGTYDDPGVYHPASPQMKATPMTVGGKQTTAALPWSTLSSAMLSRTVFFHHSTYTNGHGDATKVSRLQGAVQRQECMVSLFANNLAGCLNTVQPQPLLLSDNLITFAGAVLPTLSPPALQAVLLSPKGPLKGLQQIRDRHLDELNALVKQSGTASQRKLIDRYALSQSQARGLEQQLLNDLSQIKGTTRTDQNIAAAVLFRMGVSPVVVGRYSFGGDNHVDISLSSETSNHVASISALADFEARLATYGLTDKVTIVLQNVFGRTLSLAANKGNRNGRNHSAYHHCSVLIGSGFRGAVVGGIREGANGDFRATGINSTTGSSDDASDIPYEETLGAMGKTLGVAVGVSRSVVDVQITKGTVVASALA